MSALLHEKEIDIQSAICDYLSTKGYFFWRQNTNAVYDARRNAFRKQAKYSMNGVSDIILIKDGMFYGLEVKTSKGRQSESQKVFQEKCKENGARYYIVRSIDDLIELGI